jgi:hypothetical protein
MGLDGGGLEGLGEIGHGVNAGLARFRRVT